MDNCVDTISLLPENYEVAKPGSCMLAAFLMCVKLIELGKKDVSVVEGWIQYLDENNDYDPSLRFQHTWVLDGEEIIDPTFEQFANYTNDYFFERLVKKVYTAQFYLSTFESSDTDYCKYFSNGIIPDDVKELLKNSIINDCSTEECIVQHGMS